MNGYIADVLTRGARVEGILGATESFKESNVARHIRWLRDQEAV